MPYVIIATDSSSVANEVHSVMPAPEFEVKVVRSGQEVLPLVKAQEPDLVVLDLQTGNMGAIATSLDLRLEASGNRIGRVPILLLLDRRADVFIARRAEVDGWVIKPLDPIRLRKAVRAILDGSTYEDASYTPNPVNV